MAHLLIWAIALASIALMLIRPRGIPEVVWTSAGAILLVVLRLIPLRAAGHAVAEGTDVYLFLTGMMLLSEMGQRYGLFDWLAAIAVRRANGSASRLFLLIYGVGIVVTAFMSNDATAVVLTPAVLTAVKRAKANPVPYLFICALIANAASFLLPISNPANLVVFHQAMPPLGRWIAMFGLASIASVVVTYVGLRLYFRAELETRCEAAAERPTLPPTGRIVLIGIALVAVVLLVASALRLDLGLPTCIAAAFVALVVLLRERESPTHLLREISWSVLLLVAALFVIVQAVEQAGALELLRAAMERTSHWPVTAASLAVGGVLGFATNLVNNLPLGLITGATMQSAHVQGAMQKAVLIGIDLGPNLSITGSLATILWLIAIRKEDLKITGWQFLKAGLLIMPPSLLLALLASLLFAR